MRYKNDKVVSGYQKLVMLSVIFAIEILCITREKQLHENPFLIVLKKWVSISGLATQNRKNFEN